MRTNPIGKHQKLQVTVNGVIIHTTRARVDGGLFGYGRHERAFQSAINAIEMNPTKCVGWGSTLQLDGYAVEIQVNVLKGNT